MLQKALPTSALATVRSLFFPPEVSLSLLPATAVVRSLPILQEVPLAYEVLVKRNGKLTGDLLHYFMSYKIRAKIMLRIHQHILKSWLPL